MFKIAIIGRPNVGKSTLFNRLSKKRLAIVHDRPGVTRDRKNVEIELDGNPVLLIDTAGLEEAELDTLEAAMFDQTETAVEDAHLLLLVIDGRVGVTQTDKYFANWARKKGKPVLLIANKCEGNFGQENTSDFFKLGFGDPVLLSAEHAEGMADLYDEIYIHLDKYLANNQMPDLESAEEATKFIQICIIGRPNVGKSTFINAVLGENRVITSDIMGTTRDSINIDWQYKDRDIRLIDTAGIRKKATAKGDGLEQLCVQGAYSSLKYAQIVVLVLDASLAFEKQDMKLASQILDEGRGLVIAINKWDIVKNKEGYLKALNGNLEFFHGDLKEVPIIKISAINNKSLNDVLDAVLEVYKYWNLKFSTGKLNSWLEKAQEQVPPPIAGNKRIRMKYITQSKTRPPSFQIFSSQIKKLPESYISYLKGSMRKYFSIKYTPLRIILRKQDNPYVDKQKR